MTRINVDSLVNAIKKFDKSYPYSIYIKSHVCSSSKSDLDEIEKKVSDYFKSGGEFHIEFYKSVNSREYFYFPFLRVLSLYHKTPYTFQTYILGDSNYSYVDVDEVHRRLALKFPLLRHEERTFSIPAKTPFNKDVTIDAMENHLGCYLEYHK